MYVLGDVVVVLVGEVASVGEVEMAGFLFNW